MGFKKKIDLGKCTNKKMEMKMRNNLREMPKIEQFSKKMIKEYEDAMHLRFMNEITRKLQK